MTNYLGVAASANVVGNPATCIYPSYITSVSIHHFCLSYITVLGGTFRLVCPAACDIFSWGAAIFPRKYGRSVILERPYILGNSVAATIFPSGEISCDTCAVAASLVPRPPPQLLSLAVCTKIAEKAWKGFARDACRRLRHGFR